MKNKLPYCVAMCKPAAARPPLSVAIPANATDHDLAESSSVTAVSSILSVSDSTTLTIANDSEVTLISPCENTIFADLFTRPTKGVPTSEPLIPGGLVPANPLARYNPDARAQLHRNSLHEDAKMQPLPDPTYYVHPFPYVALRGFGDEQRKTLPRSRLSSISTSLKSRVARIRVLRRSGSMTASHGAVADTPQHCLSRPIQSETTRSSSCSVESPQRKISSNVSPDTRRERMQRVRRSRSFAGFETSLQISVKREESDSVHELNLDPLLYEAYRKAALRAVLVGVSAVSDQQEEPCSEDDDEAVHVHYGIAI